MPFDWLVAAMMARLGWDLYGWLRDVLEKLLERPHRLPTAAEFQARATVRAGRRESLPTPPRGTSGLDWDTSRTTRDTRSS